MNPSCPHRKYRLDGSGAKDIPKVLIPNSLSKSDIHVPLKPVCPVIKMGPFNEFSWPKATFPIGQL
jgi:hypothetical protein